MELEAILTNALTRQRRSAIFLGAWLVVGGLAGVYAIGQERAIAAACPMLFVVFGVALWFAARTMKTRVGEAIQKVVHRPDEIDQLWVNRRAGKHMWHRIDLRGDLPRRGLSLTFVGVSGQSSDLKIRSRMLASILPVLEERFGERLVGRRPPRSAEGSSTRAVVLSPDDHSRRPLSDERAKA